MQTQYCPECNTELTRSIVGFLCHGCGQMQGFEKIRSHEVHSSSHSVSGSTASTPSKPVTSKFAAHQPDMHESTQTPTKGVKHQVKKFVVPKFSHELTPENELPAAEADEKHLLPAKPADLAPALAVASSNQNLRHEEAESSLEETHSLEAANPPAGYLVPALAGILVVTALVLAFIIIR